MEERRILILSSSLNQINYKNLYCNKLKQFCERYNINVYFSENMKGAVDQFESYFYDVAFFDVESLSPDFYQYVPKIMRLKATAQPLLIAVTFRQDFNFSKEFLEQGFSDFIILPIPIMELEEIILRYVTFRENLIEKISRSKRKQFNVAKLLVVEDNTTNKKIMAKLLEKFNRRHSDGKPELEIYFASNGFEALEWARKYNFNLVFMDIQMPEMDGEESARRIKEMKKERTPILIALTSHTLSGDRERLIANGFDEYIGKPIRIDDLERLIDIFIYDTNAEFYYKNHFSKRKSTFKIENSEFVGHSINRISRANDTLINLGKSVLDGNIKYNKEEIKEPIKIIFLESISDKGTLYGNKIMKESPIFREYKFDFCYAVENEDSFNAISLSTRLDSIINAFNPKYLLIHTGIIFYRYPREICSILAQIKLKNQWLRIGIQMSVDKIIKLINERDDFKCQKNEIGLGEIFEESKEIKEIMSLFGYNRKYK